MAKPEWGTKRTCPSCGTRFYDLGKEDPVTCIDCGNTWTPEPVLKSKQPIPIDDPEKTKDVEVDADLGGDDDDDLKDIENIDDDNDSPDNDVDLGGDDDLGVAAGKGDDDADDDS